MAKRRRQRPQTERIYPTTNRPPTARQRRKNLPPPSRRDISPLWLTLGAVAAIAIVAVVGYAFFLAPGGPPSDPQGDGTTATIETELGTIVMEIYTESAPIASENFIDLAEAGYYDGIGFHRISPGFVIQGGDPNGDGTGGPGYTIADEPVIGEYTRGVVAMARTPAPNSQGSQFFVVLADSVKDRLPKSGGYVIFGNVTQGMEVVDMIVSRPRDGETALDPVIMESVTIQRPT